MSTRGKAIRLRQKMRGRLDERQPLLERWFGLMGDGEGNLYPDTTDTNYVYVRRTGRARVERVRNTKVMARNNLPVIVGFAADRPDEQQVLDMDDTALTTLGAYGYVKNHHQQHELNNPNGGDDTVWVDTQQFLYMLCQVTDPISEFLEVRSGVYIHQGVYKLFPGATTADLTAYAPGAGLAVMVLISVDAGSSALVYTTSADFSSALAEDLRRSQVPQPPNNSIPVAAVYVPNGATTFAWEYVYDWRVFINITSGGDAHNILSLTHLDSSPATLVRGDVLVANDAGTPLLDRLPHPGVANRILRTPDVDDVSWSDWSLIGTAGQTYTFSATGGTVPTGTGTTPRVAIWGAANTLTDDAGLSTDAANDLFIVADAGGIGNSNASARLLFDSSGAVDITYFMGCVVAANATSTVYAFEGATKTAQFFIETDNSYDDAFTLSRQRDHTSGTILSFIRSRAALAALQNNDTIARLFFRGHDGTDFNDGAEIRTTIVGAVAANTMPTRLHIFTTETNAPAERFRIDPDGTITMNPLLADFDTIIGSDNEANLLRVDAGEDEVRLGDWDTNYFTTDKNGDSWWVGGGGLPFGSCYGNGIGWTQAAAAQNTWYEISDADMATGQLNLITHDGSGELTVTLDGMYLASWTITAEADAGNVNLEVAFYVDGAATNDGRHLFETAAADLENALAGTAILDLTNTSTVAVAIRTVDAGAPDISVDNLNITLVQIGGT